MKFLIYMLVVIYAGDALSAEAPSFGKSKRILAKEIYSDHKVSFYCGCDYELKPKPNKPNKKQLTPD